MINATFENLVDATADLEAAKAVHEQATKKLNSAEAVHTAVMTLLREAEVDAKSVVQAIHERRLLVDESLRSKISGERWSLFHLETELEGAINRLHPEVDIEAHKYAVGALIFSKQEVTEYHVRLLETKPEDLETETEKWMAEVKS